MFFSKPLTGVDTFYSPRKFFGLPDGAYLYTDKEIELEFEQDISINRIEHLLGRIEHGAEAHYETFKRNDEALMNQPIKQMSSLTSKLLKTIDYKHVAYTRKTSV